MREVTYGQQPRWEPTAPRLRPGRLLVAWVVSAVSLILAALLLPGVELKGLGAALLVVLVDDSFDEQARPAGLPVSEPDAA